MHSHIGCTYLTFLHCAFSNVSSNCLNERMQKYTGCICLIFLHCAFSNVSSGHLPDMLHTCTGCIFSIFLHCAFLNAFLFQSFLQGFPHLHPLCSIYIFQEFVSFGCVLPQKGCFKLGQISEKMGIFAFLGQKMKVTRTT